MQNFIVSCDDKRCDTLYFATAAVRSSTFELNFGEYKTLTYATFVYISAMRENFALNFTQLLNNKIYIFYHHQVLLKYWKMTKLCCFNYFLAFRRVTHTEQAGSELPQVDWEE